MLPSSFLTYWTGLLDLPSARLRWASCRLAVFGAAKALPARRRVLTTAANFMLAFEEGRTKERSEGRAGLDGSREEVEMKPKKRERRLDLLSYLYTDPALEGQYALGERVIETFLFHPDIKGRYFETAGICTCTLRKTALMYMVNTLSPWHFITRGVFSTLVIPSALRSGA